MTKNPSATLLDGTSVARAIRAELKLEVAAHIAAGGNPPHLAAVLIGDDPASQTYVAMKEKA